MSFFRRGQLLNSYIFPVLNTLLFLCNVLQKRYINGYLKVKNILCACKPDKIIWWVVSGLRAVVYQLML